MRKVTLLLFLNLTLLFGYGQTGYLSVTSEPTAATIIIDGGYYSAKTPLSILELPIGQHYLELRFKDYETQTIRVTIHENVVEKRNIILWKSTGFTVKPEESSTINQAKGGLTIITDPENAEVWVNGILLQQKTPLTISEIGAGEQKIKVRNDILINGKYEKFYLEQSVQIRPNKTELIEIDFLKYFGSLSVNTNPQGAVITIQSTEYGTTPLTVKTLQEGEYKMVVSKLLGEPYNFKIEKTVFFTINGGNKTNLFFDLVKDIKLGSVNLRSNKPNHLFHFYNTSNNQKYELHASSKPINLLTGNYKVEWHDLKENNFSFQLNENSAVSIYLPVKQPLNNFKTTSDHHDYMSRERFLNYNFKPFPESKRVNVLTYWSSTRDDDRKWRSLWKYMMTMSVVSIVGIYAAGEEEIVPELITACAGTAVFSFLIMPFDIENRSRSIPENIKKNKVKKDECLSIYNKMEKKWNSDIQRENENILKENRRIEEENFALPRASAIYAPIHK